MTVQRLLGVREPFQILRNKRVVLLRRIFVGDVRRLGLVLEQPFELLNHVAHRELALKPVFAGGAEVTLGHGLTGSGHFRGGPASAVAKIVPEPLFLAGQALQTVGELRSFFAQLLFFIGDLARSF